MNTTTKVARSFRDARSLLIAAVHEIDAGGSATAPLSHLRAALHLLERADREIDADTDLAR